MNALRVFLIRLIAGDRPVLMNVHITKRQITVMGDCAHLENIVVLDTTGDAAVRVVPSETPLFAVGDDGLD